MKEKFVNRTKELALFEDEYKKSKIIIIFGRRRVGKTKLITKWGEKHNLIYTQAIEADSSIQLRQAYDDIRERLSIDIVPQNWNDFFKLISAIKDEAVIAIDEFPYLVESNSSLSSILQKCIDHDQPDNLTIFLLGSSQSMMHGLFLDSSSPLYGRANRIVHIKPMNYKDFAQYSEIEISNRDTFLKYSITGGIPKYWEYIDKEKKAILIVDDIFFSDFAYFEYEPQRIIKDEQIGGLRPLSILETIGRGASKPSEIAKRLNLKQTDISRPLQILIDTSIINRELPFGESIRSTKKVLYYISDHTLRFWFNVYSPHRSRWHLYKKEKRQNILTEHASFVLEQEFRNLYKDSARYWEGNDIEFDCVRYADQSSKNIIISEIKWRKLSQKDKESIKSNLINRYHSSSLSTRFTSAEFEVLSFEDIICRL